MSDPHFMHRPVVTRFSHGVPTELTSVCGGCEETVTGTGATLPACRDDLLARFKEHSAVTP